MKTATAIPQEHPRGPVRLLSYEDIHWPLEVDLMCMSLGYQAD